MKPHRGTLVLVLGILSLIICQPLGIVAWVLGSSDLKGIEAGTIDPSGKDLTNIGRILGIIATVLLILGIIFAILVFALGLAGAVAGASAE
ncbi:MAG: DUF4190 domain-containing protein [Terrimicrobiaceae bacterium]